MDQYLDYIGGPAGALALTGVAAASAFYLASRPTPQKPLVELHCQSRILPVSTADTLNELASNHRPRVWEVTLPYTRSRNEGKCLQLRAVTRKFYVRHKISLQHPAPLWMCNMPALYVCLTLSILLREADVSRYSLFTDFLNPAGRMAGQCL